MDALPLLNLPPFSPRLRRENGALRIFDPLRERYVALTPEEWVRQHFVQMLIEQLGYEPGLMGNEVSLRVGALARRCDTVVYDSRLRPRMIVEYKRPSVALSQRVFDQISRYNRTLRVPFLTVSNGLQHFCLRIDYDRETYTFLPAIPTWQELTTEAAT